MRDVSDSGLLTTATDRQKDGLHLRNDPKTKPVTGPTGPDVFPKAFAKPGFPGRIVTTDAEEAQAVTDGFHLIGTMPGEVGYVVTYPAIYANAGGFDADGGQRRRREESHRGRLPPAGQQLPDGFHSHAIRRVFFEPLDQEIDRLLGIVSLAILDDVVKRKGVVRLLRLLVLHPFQKTIHVEQDLVGDMRRQQRGAFTDECAGGGLVTLAGVQFAGDGFGREIRIPAFEREISADELLVVIAIGRGEIGETQERCQLHLPLEEKRMPGLFGPDSRLAVEPGGDR
jgi:hypothetical protein